MAIVEREKFEFNYKSQLLHEILALADREIEAGETVPIEDVMKEFGVEDPKKTESKPK